MPDTTILVASWSDGLYVLEGESCHHELVGRSVRGLTRDRDGAPLAIVDGHELWSRDGAGGWRTVAGHEAELSCCVATRAGIFVGTDDARMLRVENGTLVSVDAFDACPGRASWYAGTVEIDGKVLGPPLGVRSLAVTVDGAGVLANVHVGGIPVSFDGGLSWRPTIDVDADVHEVAAHPTDPESVIAATAVGLAVSRDGAVTWKIETEGLHATYCSAVAFCGSEMLVAASSDHFAAQGAVYHRAIDSDGPLEPFDGLPRRIDGIADTQCIATRGERIAIVDRAGNVYVSADAGASWASLAPGIPSPSSALVL